MKEAALKATVNGSAALAGSTGVVTSLLAFFDNNAASIGAMCTLVFGLIYILFQWLSYRKLTVADDNKHEIAQLKKQLSEISKRKQDK